MQRLTVAQVPAAELGVTLGLTDDQKTKIGAIQDKSKAELKALREAQSGSPDPEAQQKMRDLNEKTTADITAVLTDDQKTKLTAVMKDLGSLQAVNIPFETYPDLKLTDDQKTKISQIVSDNMGNLREQLQGLDRDARRQKIAEVRTAAHSKVVDILTADQKTVVDAYEKAHPRRAPRRPGAPAA